MQVKIISYDQEYENKIVELWNKCLTVDTVSIDQFRKQVLFDDNFNCDLALIALDEQEVIGFILATKRQVPYLDRGLEPERGWINLLFVKEDYRRRNVGSNLIKEVESRLVEKGAKTITLASYSPSYFFPGVDYENYPESIAFFENHSYNKAGEAVSMQRDLWNYSFPERVSIRKNQLESEGYVFKKFTYKYSMKLLKFLGVTFGGGWKRNALIAMQNNEAEKLIWICVDKNDDVVGFCMRKMDGNDCRFGPFGVSDNLRSSGIGGVLFNLMMDDMKSNKLYYLYFLWTHGAGMRFYEKHGVEVYRNYYLYNKKFD